MKRRKIHHLSQISNEVTTNRAGTINYMVLKNFMCHSFLELKFSTNIVIITGRNGSGKSAIITALALVFGGRATITNRGQSVSGFVKAGQTTAKIEIDIYNGGVKAYRPEVYGQRINITRTISIKGSSTYKIISENGELVSTEAREVRSIADILNIQIDNPTCILNQDTSRNFLHTSKPENRFKLFIQATRLDVLDAEAKRARINSEDCLRIIVEKQENSARIQSDIEQLEEKIRNYGSLSLLKKEMQQLQKEFVWAKVRDNELELDKEMEILGKLESRSEKLKENVRSGQEMVQTLKQKESDLKTQLSELKLHIDTQKKPEHDLESQINKLSTQVVQDRYNVKSRQAGIQEQKAKISDLQAEIENLSKNRSEAEDRLNRNKKKCAALQEKLKDIEDHLATAQNELFQAIGDLSRKEKEVQELRDKLRWSDGKLRSDSHSLSELDKTSDNLAMYGNDMPRVLQMMEQYKGKFKHMPQGPLGRYIKMKDKKWTLPAEQHLGSDNLRGFLADNAEDNKLLRQIFNQVWRSGRQPATITTKFISKKFTGLKHVQEPGGCVSLYNVLEIEDPVVSNCIVDIAKPESILLVPNENMAMNLLNDARRVPMHCRQAITINGEVYYPDPNYKTYASHLRTTRYLQADSSDYKRQLQQNIENLKQDMDNIRRQLVTLEQEKQSQERKKSELEGKIRKLNVSKSNIMGQLEDAIKNDSQEPAVTDPSLLEKILNEYKDLLLKKTSDMEKIVASIKVTEAQISEHEQTLSQLRDSNKGLAHRVQSVQEELEKINIQLQRISRKDEIGRTEIIQLKTRIAEATLRKERLQKKNEELILETDVVGERLHTERQVDLLNDEILALTYKIDAIESKSQNIQNMQEKLAELHGKHSKSSENVTHFYTIIDALKTTTEKRRSAYKNTESHFVSFIQFSFATFLRQRQYQGSINVNIEKKTLDLVMTPQQGSQRLTSTSNLSGGERSFTTVAFLYSLWQCLEFPFYFLDEFDVYMDKLNRTTVIDILLHHARSKPDLQFVFFSPQDISLFNESNADVSILRLEDPERAPV